MDFATCRAGAQSVHASDQGARAEGLLRPRFIAGLCRQRPPLTWLIWVASRNGRLVWRSADAFCVLDPPAATPPRKARIATWITENWSLFVMVCITAGSLIGALIVALLPRSHASVLAALAFVIGAFGTFLTFMLVHLTRAVSETARTWGPRRHLDRVLAHHWSLSLLHAADHRDLGTLLEQARRTANSAVVLVDTRRVTTDAAGAAVLKLPDARPVAETVVAAGPRARLIDPRSRRISMTSGLLLLAIAVVAGLLISAMMIADSERAVCGSHCVDRPADLANALYWLLSRMLPVEPDGVEAKTWGPRVLGICWTLFGLLVVGTGVNLLFQNALSRNESAGVDLVHRFNTSREDEERADAERSPLGATEVGRSDRPSLAVRGVWFVAGMALGIAIARRMRHRR